MTLTWRILTGDVRETLKSLPEGCVQTCVTSPPYWGLRDYGHSGQLGLETTPDAYVAAMVDVFAAVRGALADDGTLWLNLGDSYAGVGAQTGGTNSKEHGRRADRMFSGNCRSPKSVGLKEKDLCGIPWRVAFALQADGWYLRSDIIWSKPNPMPESVTDRPTKAHEYIFLLTKSARYYYDAAAIREPYAPSTLREFEDGYKGQATKAYAGTGAQNPSDVKRRIIESVRNRQGEHERKSSLIPGQTTQTRAYANAWREEAAIGLGRNKRSVWHVATQPYAGAHFATFPEALIEPCILAGTSEKGQCPACGKAWVRVIDEQVSGEKKTCPKDDASQIARGGTLGESSRLHSQYFTRTRLAESWQPSCACNAGEPIPQTVLDPFCGSGTTGAVAIRNGRNFIGCELNPAYVELAEKRIGAVAPLFAERTA